MGEKISVRSERLFTETLTHHRRVLCGCSTKTTEKTPWLTPAFEQKFSRMFQTVENTKVTTLPETVIGDSSSEPQGPASATSDLTRQSRDMLWRHCSRFCSNAHKSTASQTEPGACAGPGQADEAPESSKVPSDSESDVYSDTLEQMEPGQAGQRVAGQSLSLSSPHTAGLRADAGPESPARGGGELGEGGEPVGRSSDGPRPLGTERELQAAPGARGCPDADQGDTASAGLRPELDMQLLGTVRALQDNMRSVLKRLSHLETLSTAQGHESGSGPRPPPAALGTQKPSRWPLEVSARTLLFLLAWPFVVQWLLRRFQRRKRGLFPV
ncbi:hypothetical protein KIL84_002487 [Mauremys mutica]|uniref:Uncharacterized protein n=1 Tax=Mauremys mutica TaxID=74926 RepID=A0A9D4AXM7_9SAUR|nr:hypothetical protein KIL84_002487 [Mauremys mutica]